jgi:hypothetical protein
VFMSFIEDSTAEFTGHDVHRRGAMKLLSAEKDRGVSKCLTKSC